MDQPRTCWKRNIFCTFFTLPPPNSDQLKAIQHQVNPLDILKAFDLASTPQRERQSPNTCYGLIR